MQEKILGELIFARIHAGPVFALARIQENIFEEVFPECFAKFLREFTRCEYMPRLYSHPREYRKILLANYLCIGFVPGGTFFLADLEGANYIRYWWVPNPPFANSGVAERAPCRSMKRGVAGVSSLLDMPTDSCHFPCTSWHLVRPQYSLARKALSATRGLARGGVRHSPEIFRKMLSWNHFCNTLCQRVLWLWIPLLSQRLLTRKKRYLGTFFSEITFFFRFRQNSFQMIYLKLPFPLPG